MASSETFRQRCGVDGCGNGSGHNSIERRSSYDDNSDDDTDSTIGQILGQTNSRSFNKHNDDYDDDNGEDEKAIGDNHSILSSDFSSFSVSPLLEEDTGNYDQSSNSNSNSNRNSTTTMKMKQTTNNGASDVDQILSSLLGKASIGHPLDSSKLSKSNSSTQQHHCANDEIYVGPVDLDEIVDDLVHKKNDLYTGPVDLDDLVDDMMFFDRTNTTPGEKFMEGRVGCSVEDSSANNNVDTDSDIDSDDVYRGPVDIDELLDGNASSNEYGDVVIHHDIVSDNDGDDDNDHTQTVQSSISKANNDELLTSEDEKDEVANDKEKAASNDDNHDQIDDEEESNEVGKISRTKDNDDSLEYVQSLIAKNHSPDIADDVMEYLHSLIDQKQNSKKVACDRNQNTATSPALESHGSRSADEHDTMKHKGIPRTVHILSPTISTETSSSSSSHSTPAFSPPRPTTTRPTPEPSRPPPSPSSPLPSCELSGPVDLDATFELETEFESILDAFEVQHWKARDDGAELRNPFQDCEEEGYVECAWNEKEL